MATGDGYPPPNPLDRIIWRLERTLRDRAEHPLRRLRQAINERRAKGALDEGALVNALLEIEMRSYITGEDIDHLATKVRTGHAGEVAP